MIGKNSLEFVFLRKGQLESSQGSYLGVVCSLPVVVRSLQGNNDIFFSSGLAVNFIIFNH